MFALNEEVLDVIPTHEIATVQDLLLDEDMEYQSSEMEGHSAQESEDEDDRFHKSRKNAFIIKTIEGGYNSGRKYIIGAKNGNEMQFIVRDLTNIASKAREDAEAKSRIEKFQERIAHVFDSDMVQRILAIMILSVPRIFK